LNNTLELIFYFVKLLKIIFLLYSIKKMAEVGCLKDGNFQSLQSNGSVDINYLHYISMNRLALVATGNDISDAEADAAAVADHTDDPSDADCVAAVLVANAYNTYAHLGDAAGEMYLPAAKAGTVLAVKFTGALDAANATTIRTELLGTDKFAYQLIAADTPNTLAATIPTGAVSAVLTVGTIAAPTSVSLIYTPAGAATNFLFTNSEIWFYAPIDGQWLVHIMAIGQTTSATGALTVA
jgi:hypothetical protein